MIIRTIEKVTVLPGPDIFVRLQKAGLHVPSNYRNFFLRKEDGSVEVEMVNIEHNGEGSANLKPIVPRKLTEELISLTGYRPVSKHIFLETILLKEQGKLKKNYNDIFCLPNLTTIDDEHLTYQLDMKGLSIWSKSIFRYWVWIMPLRRIKP